MRLAKLMLGLLALLPLTGLAAPFKYTLAGTNQQGYSRHLTFESRPDGFRLNGLKLDPARVLASGPQLTVLKSPAPSPSLKRCAAGEYTFLSDYQGKTSKEEGCMESERFSQLFAAFRALGVR